MTGSFVTGGPARVDRWRAGVKTGGLGLELNVRMVLTCAVPDGSEFKALKDTLQRLGGEDHFVVRVMHARVFRFCTGSELMPFTDREILETVRRIELETLDICTTTLGIDLLDCADPDLESACQKV